MPSGNGFARLARPAPSSSDIQGAYHSALQHDPVRETAGCVRGIKPLAVRLWLAGWQP